MVFLSFLLVLRGSSQKAATPSTEDMIRVQMVCQHPHQETVTERLSLPVRSLDPI
jgi:hypothetical protein